MQNSLLTAVAAIALLTAAQPLAGQTISARPVLYKDPVWGVEPKHGEVVLGRTTLKAALRIFAVELEEDSVRVPLGHPGNPSVLEGKEQRLGVTLRHRLDLGPDRYTLYFDENERLVALDAPAYARPLQRKELAAKYPSLRVHYRGHNADRVAVMEGLEAPLGECVSLTASAWLARGDAVENLGYIYTCSTKPVLRSTR
jgi:hypothetical protein